MYFLAFAASIAAIYLLARELVPALQAMASGRIRTKGYNPKVIERASEPQRFDALVRQRMQLGLSGLGVAAGIGAYLVVRVFLRGGY